MRRSLSWLLLMTLAASMMACAPDDDAIPRAPEVLRVHQQSVLVNDLPWICGPYPEVLLNGLSLQLVDEVNCIEPGVLEHFDVGTTPGSIYIQPMRQACNGTVPNNVPQFLRPEAKAAAEGVAAMFNDFITVRSGYRDVGMQYYDWYYGQQLGFPAALPGNSNHQAGRAVDLESHNFWRQKMLDYGWTCVGGSPSQSACDSDPPHFEWPIPDVPDLQIESVRAFQRLWNRNNPGDVIDEDGLWGPNTGSRMSQTHAEGFTYGGCDVDLDGFASESIGGLDCDDTNEAIYPGAIEVCGDGIDQDCDDVDPTCDGPTDTSSGADTSTSSGADTFSSDASSGADTFIADASSGGPADTTSSSGIPDTSSSSSGGLADTSSSSGTPDASNSSGVDVSTTPDASSDTRTTSSLRDSGEGSAGCDCRTLRAPRSPLAPWTVVCVGAFALVAWRRRDRA